MAPMAATTASRKALVLVLLALLPLSTVSSRAGPSSHRSSSHGKPPKHSPPRGSPSPPPPAPAPPQPAALVRTTCNSTTYPDLCVSALSADPSSATADVRGLSAIAVSAAAANASGGAATAAALANAITNATAAAGGENATVQAALLRTCAGKYGEARDALSAAGGSIAARDYDSASVQVSAAGEYPQVCRVLFQRQRPGEYPPELAAREVALRQLCTVALDIITILSNNSG
ncbi:unnamed protein product [Urochloa decumbens]|uniref:Pectinesterase inhibitor domain-containing protein n=1 Tax=Urochloa decumbens TaxID=240449 RepID=A0ABC9BXX2_9POAL